MNDKLLLADAILKQISEKLDAVSESQNQLRYGLEKMIAKMNKRRSRQVH